MVGNHLRTSMHATTAEMSLNLAVRDICFRIPKFILANSVRKI